MVEIIEQVENHQLLLQEKGKAASTMEVEKRTQQLRVLVVDDNAVCLAVLSSQLKHCGFQVIPIREAVEALDLLKRNRNSVDIVLTDVIRFDLNGFHLMEIITRQFKIPVIMISAIDDERIMEEGKRCGARAYSVKPVRLEVLQTVCEQAIRKVPDNLGNALTLEPHYYADENETPNTKLSHDDNDGDDHDDNDDDDEKQKKKKRKKRKEGHISSSSGESSPIQKKPRVIWDARLHRKFVDAVLRLDMEKAVPMKILEIMNEPNLTRENIASHLQKFRNVVRKERERFCQELAKNPKEAMQQIFNRTIQPTVSAPGLTINLHHYNNKFSSGQEMILSNTTNFPQQISLYSTRNNQQQQLMGITNSNNSSLPKSTEARMHMSAIMKHPTIDHRNQNVVFDQEFSLQQQMLVSPQHAAMPYEEAASSSSSSSRGNNSGGHQHHHQTTNVQPFQATIGGGVSNCSDRVKQIHLSSSINNRDFYNYYDDQAKPTMELTHSSQSTSDYSIGGNNINAYHMLPSTINSNIVPFQASLSQPNTSLEESIDNVPFQARLSQPSDSIRGFIYDSIVPCQIVSSQSNDSIGGFIDNSIVPYQARHSQTTYSIGGFIDNSMAPYQAMHSQPTDSIGEFIDNSIVPYQAMSTQKLSQPINSIGGFIDNSIVPYKAMPTQQFPQPSASIERSINNSIAPYQAMPTSQPCDSNGGSLNNPITPYEAWPTISNTSLEESIVTYQAWPIQEIFQSSGHIGGSIETSAIPYQAWHTQNPSHLSDSFEENNDHLIRSINSIVPYQVDHIEQPSHAISTFGENSGEVGFTQPYITDHSSFSSQFLSSEEKKYFNEDKYGNYMQVLPTDIINVGQGNNINGEHVHDTYVGENINGCDHQKMNPLVADDLVPEIFSIHDNNIYDPPDEEITFMINELLNSGTSPSIH